MAAQNDDERDDNPGWLVERLALGELGPTEAAELRRRLESAGRPADAVLAALEASNRRILAAHPAATVAAAVHRRAAGAAPAPVRARWRGLLVGAPLAAAGLAFVLVVVRPASAPPPPVGVSPGGGPREETRSKGPAVSSAPRLVVYRRGRSGTERLADGARAARGDLVQLATANGSGTWGVLLSIDGAGRVTLHWPERGAEAASLAAAELRLPSSYELDDAPAFERFLLVSADRPFEVGSVLDAARALAARPGAARVAPLPLGGRFGQVSLTLVKASGGSR
jgi:hypothetical protein